MILEGQNIYTSIYCLLCLCLKKTNLCLKQMYFWFERYMHPNVHCNTACNSQDMEAI